MAEYDEVAVSFGSQLPDEITFYDRVRLAWAVLTGKRAISLNASVYASVDTFKGLSMSTWTRGPDEKWKQWGVTFDGSTPARGYINGELVDHDGCNADQ